MNSSARFATARKIEAAVRRSGAVMFYARNILWAYPADRIPESLRKLVRRYNGELIAIIVDDSL